ncbi:SymE family type I addiction module toxin [Caballeronia arvi]|uniref:SymE family type I addiction module toxin n=1 Tax=Caballeronia arvi TaxID=1777135 RepID=UPI001F20C140
MSHSATVAQPNHTGSNPSRRVFSALKLAGRWFEQAGFQAGQRVKINVEHGRLTITDE